LGTSNKNSENFAISLRENGIHSLSRGIEAFVENSKSQEKMLLKEAIMFLHHGVELLMKQILIKSNAFLIFEDLRDAARKQKQADKLGVNIFMLNPPPKTVTFEEAINRVEAFIKPSKFGTNLRDDLVLLNQLRNQLEHYAIEVDKEDVVQLLSALHNPLLDLFDDEIGNIRRGQPFLIERGWDQIEDLARFYSEMEDKVYKVVQLFDNQRIPGHLFNSPQDIILPKFSTIKTQSLLEIGGNKYRSDILGENDNGIWLVEVKGMVNSNAEKYILEQLTAYRQQPNLQVWLVMFKEISKAFREEARKRNILVTGDPEWKELRIVVNA
jgi:hypothetical protein